MLVAIPYFAGGAVYNRKTGQLYAGPFYPVEGEANREPVMDHCRAIANMVNDQVAVLEALKQVFAGLLV